MSDRRYPPRDQQQYGFPDSDGGNAIYGRRPSAPELNHTSHDNRAKPRRPSVPAERPPYDLHFMNSSPFHPRLSVDNQASGTRRPSLSAQDRPYTSHDSGSHKSSLSASRLGDSIMRRPSTPSVRPGTPFDNPPLKSGLVMCKNPKSFFLSQWKRRDLVLRETLLQFCNTKTGKSVLTIDLASVVHVGRSENLDNGFCITHGTSKKQMACQVENDTILYEWIDAIYSQCPKLNIITDPTNLQHDIHVDLDPNTGDFVGLPIEWEGLLRANMLTKADYHENPQAFMEAMDFYIKKAQNSPNGDNDHTLSTYRASGLSSSSDSIYSIYTEGESSPVFDVDSETGGRKSYHRRDSSKPRQYPSGDTPMPSGSMSSKVSFNHNRIAPAAPQSPFIPSRAAPAIPGASSPSSSSHGVPGKQGLHHRGESSSLTKQLLNKTGNPMSQAPRLKTHKSQTSGNISPKSSSTARGRPSSPRKPISDSSPIDPGNPFLKSLPKPDIQQANSLPSTSDDQSQQTHDQHKPHCPPAPPVLKQAPSMKFGAVNEHPSLAVDPLNLSKKSTAFNLPHRPPPTTAGNPPQPVAPPPSEPAQQQIEPVALPPKPPGPKPKPRTRRIDPKVAEERDRRAIQDLKQVVSQETNNPYQVFKPGRQLGSGASGTVCSARFIDPARTAESIRAPQFLRALARRHGYRPCVALKEMDILKQPRKQLIVNEIITMRSSRHVNIVNFVSSYLSADERRLWIAMELMEVSLTNIIDKNAHISEEQIARITLEVSLKPLKTA